MGNEKVTVTWVVEGWYGKWKVGGEEGRGDNIICKRRVTAQDVLFALILWYVAKTLFRS